MTEPMTVSAAPSNTPFPSPALPSRALASHDAASDGPPTVEALRARYPHHGADAILSHPRYRDARGLFVSGMMEVYDNNPFLNQLLVQAGRMVLFNVVMCLWADYDPRDRATWPTGTRLKAQLQQFGLASPRHIDNILARLVATDYLVLRTVPDDGRIRLIEPTERMVAHDLRMLLPFYRALDLLYGEARYAGLLGGDRACQLAQRKAAIGVFPWSARILSRNADLMHFLARPSAIHILLKFVELGATGPDRPVRELSFADLGARFGMSRSHVRNVLRDAENAGLVERSGPAGVFHHLTPRCVASFDRFVAEALSSSDLSCAMAFATDVPRSG